ncbi:MAG: SulP family inorganic anion transporter [Planctomycetota bacterium]
MKIFQNLRQDLPASIVVLFVAVPLCLGIALASGAPAISGLIAGVIGGIVVGSMSGSHTGVSGPAAGLAVLVLSMIERLGSLEAFFLAVVLAGVIQIALGVARAGVLGYFFPSAVIKGMLAGIGIIIVLKQIPHAFGYDADPEGELQFMQPDGETTFSELARIFSAIEPSAVIVAAVSLAILIFWERMRSTGLAVFRWVQGPLVAVVFGILYQLATREMAPEWALSSSHLVKVPVADSLSGLGEMLRTPDWSQIWRGEVYIAAITIAVVASLETLLCVEATDKLDPHKRVTPTNRELFAQGAGNVASGLIGGLPITQVIVRSSANIQSGARTKLSAILHGVLLLIFVVALPQVLNLVPLAVLASILFVVGYKLAKPSLFRDLYRMGYAQFVPFVVTVLGIVFTDLLTGIGIGMAVAILVILRRNYLNSHFLHIADDGGDNQRPRIRMQLSEEVTFLNKGAIIKELAAVQSGTHVTFDFSRSVALDDDVKEVIDEFRATAEERGISTRVIEPGSQPRDRKTDRRDPPDDAGEVREMADAAQR